MELLDAVLAFALTMGALATVVTIIMEGLHRAWKVRKRDLVELVKQLNLGLTWLDEEERWTFACSVLSNPLRQDLEV